MLMPVLRPIPLVIKGLPFWRQVWVLLTAPRLWRVVGDWQFRLPDGTIIIIPDGFVLDLASTPKFMWGLIDPTGVLMIPGVVHDFGYRYNYLWAIDCNGCYYKYRHGAGRRYWDSQFLEIDLETNEIIVTGYLSWIMLKIFGGFSWHRNRRLQSRDILPSS